jgi:hypothetical protein
MGRNMANSSSYRSSTRDLLLSGLETWLVVMRLHEIYTGINGQERICLVDNAGRVHHYDIDDLIEEWHGGHCTCTSLHEHLGMTWEEYKDWVARRCVQ